MIAHDSRPDLKTLHSKTLAFLRSTRDLFVAADGKFAKELLEHYLGIYLPSKSTNKVLAHMRLQEAPPLPPRIPEGFKQELHHSDNTEPIRYYRSTFGALSQDVLGVRAFQRDYLPYLDEIIATIDKTEQVTDSVMHTVDKLSAFVMGFCGKSSTPQDSRKHASSIELGHVLLHSQPVDLLTLKLAASNLMIRDNIQSLGTAIVPLIRRARETGVFISSEMERDLVIWAGRNEPIQFSSIPSEHRNALVARLRIATTQLLASSRGNALELEWMARAQDAQRNFEYRYDNADKNPAHPDYLPEYPEVNYRFARALRLTMPELNDLKRASEFLEREGLSGLRVEMDQSPFLWPRIAETILFAKPSEIVLHSPTALEPFEAPTEKAIKPFLCQRTMHVIPVTLTTSPKEIIEQEVHLAGKGSVEWASSVRGEANLGDQKISMTIEPNMQVSDAVRAFAPHIKPNSNSFTIRDPKAAPSAPPRAFGVFFSERSPSLPGHTTHAFGKTVCLFVAQAVKEVEAAALPQTVMPTVPAAVEPPAPPLTSTTLPIIEQIEVTLPATPTAPEQPAPPTPKAEVMVPKKVKKAPPPPPVKEPRPRISDEHAQVAKEVVAALPEIQTAARSSRALKPEVPFTDPEMATTLHILKNGEKPGTKKLKALREYVLSEGNFRDAMGSSTLRAARQRLGALLDTLLS
jgi:hypothetical protein